MEIARRAFDRNDFGTLIPAVEALVAIGDSRGLPILDQMIKESGQVPQLRDQLTTLQEQLRKSAASSSAPATPRP
jgi:hypothetical protein